MNDNLKNWLKDLKKIDQLIQQRQKYESIASSSFEDYLDQHNLKMPVKKELKQLPDYPRATYIGYAILAIFFIIIGVVFLALMEFFSSIVSIFCGIVFILVGILCLIGAKKDSAYYDETMMNIENITNYNNDAEDFNENQYDELLSCYNKSREKLLMEYEKIFPNAKNELEIIYGELDKLKDVLHHKYYPNIKDLIDIVEEGRADSKKEAISVLLDDINRWQQQQEQIEHNKRMEEYAEMQTQIQAELAQAQAEAAYRQANAAEESARNTEEMRKEIEKSFRK